MPLFVLDTSAILCLLQQEDGFERVRDLSADDRTSILLPFVALMEIEYWLLRRLSPSRTDQALVFIDSWPIEVIDSDLPWRRAAAQLKARVTLSVADAWIASLALQRGGILVHKDPEYDQVPELQVVRLPYRQRGG